MRHEPAQAFFHKTHIQPRRGARFEGGMKKNNGFRSNKEQVLDPTVVAMERMQRYCAAHPGSPSAARRPQLFLRSHLWIALWVRAWKKELSGSAKPSKQRFAPSMRNIWPDCVRRPTVCAEVFTIPD